VRIRPGSLGTWRGKRLKELKPVAVRVLGMRLARGPEVFLDAEVEFDVVAAEPAPARRRIAAVR
jgi:hypothetical protein